MSVGLAPTALMVNLAAPQILGTVPHYTAATAALQLAQRTFSAGLTYFFARITKTIYTADVAQMQIELALGIGFAQSRPEWLK